MWYIVSTLDHPWYASSSYHLIVVPDVDVWSASRTDISSSSCYLSEGDEPWPTSTIILSAACDFLPDYIYPARSSVGALFIPSWAQFLAMQTSISDTLEARLAIDFLNAQLSVHYDAALQRYTLYQDAASTEDRRECSDYAMI